MEFMHAHLNGEKSIPAAFFFRSKAYDDQMAKTLRLEGNDGEASIYEGTYDGSLSAGLLDDLRQRINQTEDRCLKIINDYDNPDIGARLMYEVIIEHLTTNVFRNKPKDVSREVAFQQQHLAYLSTHKSIGTDYIGMDDVLEELSRNNASNHVLLVGGNGTGRSALLANFVGLVEGDKDSELFYHFVSCTNESTSPKNILCRLAWFLDRVQREDQDVKIQESPNTKLDDMNTQDLLYLVNSGLTNLANARKAFYILIDDIDRVREVNVSDKLEDVLYWLPTNFPENFRVIVSCHSTKNSAVKAKLSKANYSTLQTRLATEETTRKLLVSALGVKGKELTDNQILKVCSNANSSNYLFLDVLKELMCSHGNFFTLDSKIDQLAEVGSTGGLFELLMLDLERDFLDEEGMRDDVIPMLLTSLMLTKYGMTENELLHYLDIPYRIYSLIYFALFPFVSTLDNVIALAYPSFVESVRKRYLDAGNGDCYKRRLAEYFQGEFDRIDPTLDGNSLPNRVIQELPALLFSTGMFKELTDVLSNLRFFEQAQRLRRLFEIWEFWERMELSGELVLKAYMKSLDVEIVLNYIKHMENWSPIYTQPLRRMTALLSDLTNFFLEFSLKKEALQFVERSTKIHESYLAKFRSRSKPDHLVWTELQLSQCYLDTGSIYYELGSYTEAERFHNKSLDIRLRYAELKDSQLGHTYNALGLLYIDLLDHEKAISYLEKSYNIFQDNNDSISLSTTLLNLSSCYFFQNKFDSAKDGFETALLEHRKHNFGRRDPVFASLTVNIANCERRLGNHDVAKALYEEGLAIQIDLYGECSSKVAITLTCMGNLELVKSNYEQCIRFYERTANIFLKISGEEHLNYLRAVENMALGMWNMDRNEESLETFEKAGKIFQRLELMHLSDIILAKKMIYWCHSNGRFEDLYSLAIRIIDSGKADALHYYSTHYYHYYLAKPAPLAEKYSLETGLRLFPDSDLLLETMKELCALSNNDH